MLSKNNVQAYQPEESKQRFGLRKLSIGVASVLLGTTFIYGGGASSSCRHKCGSTGNN